MKNKLAKYSLALNECLHLFGNTVKADEKKPHHNDEVF
jgi:hypothetical protein